MPEKGLYFGLRGRVYSCCFNKAHVLGNYPAQSIREIWEGSQANLLRNAVRNKDLSLGCGGCHQLIKARNINSLPILSYDRLAPKNGGFPAKMDFELFNTCNLECIMCRGEFSSTIRKNREGLPPIESPYDQAFFDEVEAFIPHLKNSHFLGGEPFLIPQYVDLWERMAAINPVMSVSVQTNCTVLNQRIKDVLERMCFDISVSIDSLDPENYPRIRKNGDLGRVLENLRYFREYTLRKGTLLTMSMCPMPQNWREIPDVVRFCNEQNISLKFTTVESPTDCSLIPLPSRDLNEIAVFLSLQVIPDISSVSARNKQSLNDLAQQILFWKEAASEREKAGLERPVGDLSAYINLIEAHLVQRGTTPSNAKAEADLIGQKLRYVIDVAEGHGRGETAEAKIIQTPVELVLRSVPTLNQDQLLSLFEQFVMPLS